MAVSGFYSVEEQRALVYEYLCLSYGGKGRFLRERGLSVGQVRRWRSQVFADTLEQGLVPRAGAVVSVDEAGALRRLLEENQALREQLAARDGEHRRELAARDEELAIQRRAVDALGKAIEVLQQSGEDKNSTGSAANGDEVPSAAPPRRRRR